MATGKKSRCLIPGLQGAGIFTPSCSRGALSRGVLKAEQDTASRVRASQAQAREVLGHRPAPLRGSATCWLDAVQANAEKSAGCAGTSSLATCTRKRGPETQNRRKGAPEGVSAASGVRRSGNHAAAQLPRRASRRSLPLTDRGAEAESKPRARRSCESAWLFEI
jgi:hypothetical protein